MQLRSTVIVEECQALYFHKTGERIWNVTIKLRS